MSTSSRPYPGSACYLQRPHTSAQPLRECYISTSGGCLDVDGRNHEFLLYVCLNELQFFGCAWSSAFLTSTSLPSFFMRWTGKLAAALKILQGGRIKIKQIDRLLNGHLRRIAMDLCECPEVFCILFWWMFLEICRLLKESKQHHPTSDLLIFVLHNFASRCKILAYH